MFKARNIGVLKRRHWLGIISVQLMQSTSHLLVTCVDDTGQINHRVEVIMPCHGLSVCLDRQVCAFTGAQFHRPAAFAGMIPIRRSAHTREKAVAAAPRGGRPPAGAHRALSATTPQSIDRATIAPRSATRLSRPHSMCRSLGGQAECSISPRTSISSDARHDSPVLSSVAGRPVSTPGLCQSSLPRARFGPMEQSCALLTSCSDSRPVRPAADRSHSLPMPVSPPAAVLPAASSPGRWPWSDHR